MTDDPDRYGSAKAGTEYSRRRRPTSSEGFARSLWAMIALALVLVPLVGWLLLHPVSPNSARPGTAGDAATTGQIPATGKN